MKNIKSRNVNLLVLFSISIFVSSIMLQASIIKNKSNELFLIDEKKDLKSSYFDLAKTPIEIDESGGIHPTWDDWSAASSGLWCTGGNGDTPSTPYIIENLVINGGGSQSCITICNSDKYFIIRNCTLYNSNSDGAGIILIDVGNAMIINNTIESNNGFGIRLVMDNDRGADPSPISHNNLIENNTIKDNNKKGITIAGKIIDSTLHKYMNTTISNNVITGNGEEGIYLYYGDENIIKNNQIKNNYMGIKLLYSYDTTISDNTANDNTDAGIQLKSCDGSLGSNTLSGNTVDNNKYGIYFYTSSDNYIGTGNTARGNTQYGIYLSERSHRNTVSGNTASNNEIYDICYDNDCEDNIFINNNVAAIDVDNPPIGGGFPIEYLFTLLFIIFFVAVIGSVGYLSRKKNIRLREQGVVETFTEQQPRVVFVRPGLVVHESTTSYSGSKHDHEPITPMEIDPYEFYCAKCDQKSLGYQVFCSTCGERMRQPKLATMHDPNEKVQCVICHAESCSTCNHAITGEDACYEECPYCERSYHKHCWEKTMNGFGKCGFCLETPPPELMPNSYK